MVQIHPRNQPSQSLPDPRTSTVIIRADLCCDVRDFGRVTDGETLWAAARFQCRFSCRFSVGFCVGAGLCRIMQASYAAHILLQLAASCTPMHTANMDFESAASASSAIPALGRLFHCTAAVANFEYDHAGSEFFTGAAIIGNSTRKVAPSPERLSTPIEPRCCVTIHCAMASPRPAPPCARLRALSTR